MAGPGGSRVGVRAGIEVGVGLNSGGEELQLTDFKLLVWCMQRVTETVGLSGGEVTGPGRSHG